MERKNKFYIPVVRDKEKGSWAYRGAAGKKETLGNLEALRGMGVDLKDVDLIPVIEPRKDKFLRFTSGVATVLGLLDIGIQVWKWVEKKKKEKSVTRKDSGKV